MLFEDGNGTRFIGKFDDGTRPYIIPNEITAGRLASHVQLNAPKFREVIRYQGEDYVLLEWIVGSAKFVDVIKWYDVERSFKNLDVFRRVYCFDFWIGNVDRNFGNLMVRKLQSEQDPELWIIDHERALLDCGPDDVAMKEIHGMICQDVVEINYHEIVEQCYQSRLDFDASIATIQSVSNAQIEDAVFRDTDELFVGKDFRTELVSNLKERRDRLGFYMNCLFQSGRLSEKL